MICGAAAAEGARPSDAAPPAAMRPDPAVRSGVLPNGLRYAVMHNATPTGEVSLRLGIDVGSYEEGDDERGVAHFLEHMAFNGGRHFQDGEIDKTFALMGVVFGRDLNAFTGLTSTTYVLDLPSADWGQIDLGLQWLRDVADGLTLTQVAADRERRIIMAEREARTSPSSLAQTAIGRFLGPELRSVDREPIGTPESIASIGAERLRSFYERWYRPPNAVVVLVGDLPVEELEASVRAKFGSWTGRAVAPTRAAVGAPKMDRGLDIYVRADPNLPNIISVCRIRPIEARAPSDPARYKQETISRLARSILERRLQEIQAKTNPPYLTASLSPSGLDHDAAGTCLNVSPINDDWEGGLMAAQAELKRFVAVGPTENEVEHAIEQERSLLRGAIGEAATRATPSLASSLLVSHLERRTFAAPREAMRAFDVAVDDLAPEQVVSGFRQSWSGAGPLITLIAPKPPDASRISSAWLRAEASKAATAYVDEGVSKWAYADFGPAGSVLRREVFDHPSFVRFTFRNGAVLNFKQTAFEKGSVDVRVRFGAGRREIENRQLVTAELGAGMLQGGGLGKHSADQLASMFRNVGWGAQMSVQTESFTLRGATTSDGLGRELQILAAFLTDPGFRSEEDAKLPTAFEATYRVLQSEPAYVLGDALSKRLWPDNLTGMPPLEQARALRFADFAPLLKPAMTQAPLELTIVGDIDEKTASALTARTFGALAARGGGDRAKADTNFLRFPDLAMDTVRAVHEGPQDKAMVGLFWPLYVATPERRREEFALSLVSAVLQDALRKRIREELGKTYAPVAQTAMPDHADQGDLIALAETFAGDVDAVTTEMKAVAARLARGDISAEALEAARAPILSSMDRDMSRNRWWCSVLSTAAGRPGLLREIESNRDLMASIRVDDVRKAAARWLTRAPFVVVATPDPTRPANR